MSSSIPSELELDATSEAELAAAAHMLDETSSCCASYSTRTPSGKPRTIRLRFGVSPVAIHGDGRVEAIEVVRNRLVPDGRGSVRAEPTGETETDPVRGRLSQRRLSRRPDRGRAVRRVDGDDAERTRAASSTRRDAPVRGLYCAGWIKRGPTGVIGTNKKDGTETAAHVLEDAAAGSIGGGSDPRRRARGVSSEGAASTSSRYTGWEAIDAAERAAGEPLGRPRVKLTGWDDLLGAARN